MEVIMKVQFVFMIIGFWSAMAMLIVVITAKKKDVPDVIMVGIYSTLFLLSVLLSAVNLWDIITILTKGV